MRQKPEVADADEPGRQHVQQESAQELVGPQGHQTLFVFVSGIAPAESDDAVGECDEAMVRDGDAMGVLAEVAKRMLGPAEGMLRVHHPWGAEQRTKLGGERLRILQRGECSVEAEFVLRMQLFEALYKLAPKHFPENTDRQEET